MKAANILITKNGTLKLADFGLARYLQLFSFGYQAQTHFKNKLRTIPASEEEQSLKFSIKVVNKTAASAAHIAKCILLHAYSCTTAVPSCARTQKLHIVYLTSWHNKFLGDKLRTWCFYVHVILRDDVKC